MRDRQTSGSDQTLKTPIHTNSDRRKDSVAPQWKHHHLHRNARRKNHPRRPPAQEGPRNPAVAPTPSIREAASQLRAVSPRDRCQCTLHYDRRCYCEHALTPTQTPKTWTVAPTKLQSPVDHNQTAENVSEHRRVRDLNWHLPKRILRIHFAQYDACPATESSPQIQDMPNNIAQYVTELTRWSRRKIDVFVDACH